MFLFFPPTAITSVQGLSVSVQVNCVLLSKILYMKLADTSICHGQVPPSKVHELWAPVSRETKFCTVAPNIFSIITVAPPPNV